MEQEIEKRNATGDKDHDADEDRSIIEADEGYYSFLNIVLSAF